MAMVSNWTREDTHEGKDDPKTPWEDDKGRQPHMAIASNSTSGHLRGCVGFKAISGLDPRRYLFKD